MPKKRRHSKYKSGLEVEVAQTLSRRSVQYEYESYKVPFTQPATKRVYIPDFVCETKSGKLCFIEAKGKLDADGRKKLLWVKEQHPKLDVKLVFQRANNKIRKGSKTTYGDWATKHGFDWIQWDGKLPSRWFN